MFYAHFVLAKKGPLAKIWLAAHWDKKLTKAHVFETNIEKSVDGILKPKVKMALRTSGHLLLGVVRIYSRKAKYLLADCNEAFVKIKMAFRPGMVDLPEEHREAAMNAITLPEVFHDFDTAIPELNDVDIEAQFSLNQSRAEEITMREDYGSLSLVPHDDGFGDIGFDAEGPDMMREAMGPDGSLEQSNLLFGDGTPLDMGHGKDSTVASSSEAGLAEMVPGRPIHTGPPPPMDDGFGGTIGDDFGHAGGLFEGDLFGEVTASGSAIGTVPGLPGSAPQQQSLQAEIEAATAARENLGVPETPRPPLPGRDSDDDDDLGGDHYDVGMSPAHSWDGSPHEEERLEGGASARQAADLMPPPSVAPPMPVATEAEEAVASTSAEAEREPPAAPAADQTTLLHNEDESFALPPVDQSALRGITKTKRKRKLIVDEVKNIPGDDMKNQLSNTSDIVTTLDLAPPTKLLMHWKETGGVEKLFALAARPMPSKRLFKMYQRNMIHKNTEIEEPPAEAEAPGRPHSPPQARRSGRKRKVVIEPEPDIEPPTPIPHDYQPSVETPAHLPPGTPAYSPMPSVQDIEAHLPGGATPGGMTPGGLAHGMDGGSTPAGLAHGRHSPPHTPFAPHPGLSPGGLAHGGLTPAGLHHGGMTPVGLHHGGMTPAGLHHGGMTPVGLHHGGMTPAGLHHGGMTPAGLHHGGMTPAGLHHGGMTPAGLHHGGMTPAGLHHGGMTPAGLHHGGMTPAGLHHGGMTPAGLHHGGMTPAGLHHVGMTPVGLQHGDMLHSGMTPAGLQHGMEDMPMMPHLPGDQVSSFLGEAEVAGGDGAETVAGVAPSSQHLEHTVPMEPLSLHTIAEQTPHYQMGIGVSMANMGYDDTHPPHSPQDDYELPPSVDHGDAEAARQADETEEQFSERVLNRRAAQLFSIMRPRLQLNDSSMKFTEIASRHNTKKIVAQKFYSLLVLKKFQVLQLQQEEAYGDIVITRGNQFETEAM